MKAYPLKGPGVVMLSGLVILFIGMGTLLSGLAPTVEPGETTEMKLENGGYSIHEIQDVVYGTTFSFSVGRNESYEGEVNIAFYFLDEEDFEDLDEWLGGGNSTPIRNAIERKEILHTENITGDHGFDITMEYEGDIYLLILNNGEEQFINVRWESSQGYPLGVCSFIFLVLGVVGVLVMKASRDIIE